MSLQLAYEKTDTGESYADAYHRVLKVVLDADANITTLTIGVYKDEATRLAGKQPVKRLPYEVSGDQNSALFSDKALASSTPLQQAYGLLKVLPQYDGAKDV